MSIDFNLTHALELIGQDYSEVKNRVGTLENTSLNTVRVVEFAEAGKSDQAAFQAAIDSLPETPASVYLNGELYSYSVVVGSKVPELSADAFSYYHLTDYIDLGARSVTWYVDDSVRFGASNSAWPYLNAPVVTERGVHMPGFGNKKDTTGHTVTLGAGALGSREALISGFTPDTVDVQAYQHERGKSATYWSVGDSSRMDFPGTGVVYTENTVVVPSMPLEKVKQLRVGMFIDTAGPMTGSVGVPARHTTRIVDWSYTPSSTTITTEVWRAMDETQPYTASKVSVPPNGTALTVNPANKIWGNNLNVFITSPPEDGQDPTSGCFIEAAFANNTGVDAGVEFDRETHPFHLWGFDASHIGDNGGGIGFVARGKSGQAWTEGFRSVGSTEGFVATGPQDCSFVARADSTGSYASAFKSQTKISGVFDTNFEVGAGPDVSIGRRTVPSTPTIRFFSDGTGVSTSSLSVDPTGKLEFNSPEVEINNALVVSPTEISGNLVQGSYNDSLPGKILKTGAFGLGFHAIDATEYFGELNTNLPTGFYFASSPSVTGSPHSSGECHVLSSNTGSENAQVAVSGGEMWIRTGTATLDPDWVSVYSSQNVVGTVSETSGSPTGAVIETGTNSGGRWIKFADGTMICTKTLQLGYTNSALLNAVWAFPQTFAEVDHIEASPELNSVSANSTPSIDELGICGPSGTTLSGTTISLYRVAGTTDFQPGDFCFVRCKVIGRWFI